MATLIASAEGALAGLGIAGFALAILGILLIFSPLLCWNELVKIRKILERMANENGGAGFEPTRQAPSAPTAPKPTAPTGGYSSIRKGGWNR